jgi:hypothetical protein
MVAWTVFENCLFFGDGPDAKLGDYGILTDKPLQLWSAMASRVAPDHNCGTITEGYFTREPRAVTMRL